MLYSGENTDHDHPSRRIGVIFFFSIQLYISFSGVRTGSWQPHSVSRYYTDCATPVYWTASLYCFNWAQAKRNTPSVRRSEAINHPQRGGRGGGARCMASAAGGVKIPGMIHVTAAAAAGFLPAGTLFRPMGMTRRTPMCSSFQAGWWGAARFAARTWRSTSLCPVATTSGSRRNSGMPLVGKIEAFFFFSCVFVFLCFSCCFVFFVPD